MFEYFVASEKFTFAVGMGYYRDEAQTWSADVNFIYDESNAVTTRTSFFPFRDCSPVYSGENGMEANGTGLVCLANIGRVLSSAVAPCCMLMLMAGCSFRSV